jgi:SAM-dependent methyltransferase
MTKLKDKDLQIGDVVEFKTNGSHEKFTGIVFKDKYDRLAIQCADIVVGASKDDVGGRNYKLISRTEKTMTPKIYPSKLFPESALAHQLLDGLVGLECGGAAHNAFGLNTLNVDRVSHEHPDFAPYAEEQMRLCGEVMPVDIVAPGDCIPVPDQSYDFVISSHVIEHFYDPISAIKEWMRIATRYIFIIVPKRDALESDREKPLTGLDEHVDRYERHCSFLHLKDVFNPNLPADMFKEAHDTDEHHSRWTLESFCDMCDWICRQDFGKGWEICKAFENDDKVGNGHCIVLKKINA